MYGKVYLSIDFYKRNNFFAMSFLSFNFYILNPYGVMYREISFYSCVSHTCALVFES